MKRKLIIEWDNATIDHHFENCDDLKTSEVLGVLEMVKYVIYKDALIKE